MHASIAGNQTRLYLIHAQSNDRHFLRTEKVVNSCTTLLFAACLGLGGCGGGGGNGSGAAPLADTTTVTPPVIVTPPASPSALANYAGTWYGPCQGRLQDTATLKPAAGGANALQLNLVRNFHAADGCAGTAVASETLSADFTLAYGSTTTAAALLAPGATVVQVALDMVTITIPAYSRTRAGPAVTTTDANGVRTWCIAYAEGPSCSADAGLQPAASAPGALYLDKGELVLLSPSGGGYVADTRYTKERATTAQSAGPAFSRVDTVQGSGTLATSGRTLSVNYTGWLYDATKPDFKGAQFDTSIGKTPFTFRLGAGQVIAGWDQGLPGMRAGGKRTLVIPASLAYGQAGSGTTIPPNAALIFEVDLISVQ